MNRIILNLSIEQAKYLLEELDYADAMRGDGDCDDGQDAARRSWQRELKRRVSKADGGCDA
jgi:hypothetical protein